MNTFAQLSAREQAERMHQLALTAITLWPVECLRLEPLKVRENAVYSVHTPDHRRAVLRVHRAGYHSDAALHSELAWMQALAASGIEVPQPIPSRAGKAFELIHFAGVPGTRQVDVFEWIDGQPLGSVEHGLSGDPANVQRIYATVGQLAARMHNQASTWLPPASFRRHSWCKAGLVGETPLWGRFWDLAGLSPSQRAFFKHLRARLSRDLSRFASTPDRFGLIHADLVPENILVDGDRVRIIDFDDAGFGWHLFEIATSLYFIRRESYYEHAREALIAGYRQHRALPDEHLRLLPMFLAARGTTYLGWIHTRKGEPAAQDLTPRIIDLAIAAAEDYLAAAPPLEPRAADPQYR
jgi:Ser/Thr protein kinase RdoA (MazF antagonist)